MFLPSDAFSPAAATAAAAAAALAALVAEVHLPEDGVLAGHPGQCLLLPHRAAPLRLQRLVVRVRLSQIGTSLLGCGRHEKLNERTSLHSQGDQFH